jgi:hypothetical protein
MKHTRSSCEWEIRDAVVARFRELWPDARIIHEMNVEHGSSRADVVAVQPDRLWICEVKSERDKLNRLPGQIKDFGPACHGLIVAAHERWTKTNGASSLLSLATAGCHRFDTWAYPEPERRYGRDWGRPYRNVVPWPHKMLTLLWADELRAIASKHRVACKGRTPAHELVVSLSRLLTGAEIEKAVCGMLRLRTFVEADAPIEVAA